MGETNQPKKPDTTRGGEPHKAPVSGFDEAGRDPNAEHADDSNKGRKADSDDENERDESANPGQRADDADESDAGEKRIMPGDLSRPAKDPYGV